MPNLNLTHSGNMNITSASIEGNQLRVSYEPNNTGAVTGFTFAPPQGTEFVCGETYTITATPRYSGTVLTETFVISGVDEAGVVRNDSSVLRQGYDTDLTHYELDLGSVGATILSSSVTSDYVELVVRIDDDDYAEIDIQPDGGGVITYPIDNISGGEGPDTGTVASSVTIVVADSITDSGWASASFAPMDATVSLRYSSSDTSLATIDPVSGEITVLADGVVEFCVTDSISTLSDCKTVTVEKSDEPGPDTGDTGTTVITSLTLSVAEEIVENGVAIPIYSPSDVETSFVFTSSNPELATIDSGGNITVLDNGIVTFCVEDEISGLQDCKTVSVRKAVYIDWIEIVVDDEITLFSTASSVYSPSNATVSLVYTSSDPEIATIDPITGEIIGQSTGEVIFCVRDLYTNKSDCKMVSVKSYPKICVTYNTDDQNLTREDIGTFVGQFAGISKAEYDGVEVELTNAEGYAYYQFPDSGNQTLCLTMAQFCIPNSMFTTPAFGSNVVSFALEEISTSSPYHIGLYAFERSPYLEEVVIPNGWDLDYYNAQGQGQNKGDQFVYCTNLRSVSFGNNVTNIPSNSFGGCHRLESVSMSNSIKKIWSRAFADCISLSAITIPSVEHIGYSAFQGCTSLLSVTLPEGIQTMGQDIFSGCTSLTTVNFPDDFNVIPVGFCNGCTSLTGFTFHQNITQLFERSFRGCNGLTEMTFLGENPPVLTTSLGNTGSTFPIYVKCSAYYNYKFDDGWEIYKSRIVPLENECSTAITVEVTYSIETTGNNVLLKNGYQPLVGNTVMVNRVYLEDGTTIYSGNGVPSSTTISYNFDETGSTKVYYDFFEENIYFLTRLPDSAKSIYIPGKAKSKVDVSHSSGLTTLALEYGITQFTVSWCTSLTGVTIPESVKQCDFGYCSSLTSITIPENVTSVPSFQGCSSLETVELHQDNSVTPDFGFSGCTSLNSIYSYGINPPRVTKWTFDGIKRNGVLYYPSGSNYSSWLSNNSYYLGYWGWTGSPTLT